MVNDKIGDHLFILIGSDRYNDLGLLRSLGESGIRSILISIQPSLRLINKCKYLNKIHLCKNTEEAVQLLIRLYGNEEKKPFVYSACDEVAGVLDDYYDQIINKFFFFHGAHKGDVNKYMKKDNINALAVECGLNIPRETVVTPGTIPDGIKYPIITKASDPTLYNWKGDMHVCYSEEELKEAFSKIRSKKILIEEFIEKKNELCLDGLCINGGKDLFIPFESSYYRFKPTSYGNYIYFNIFERPYLLEKVRELFIRIGFTGIFSVEFLIDKEDKLYFTEVNLRNSTWSQAHTYGGANLPLLWAESTLTGHIETNNLKLKEKQFSAMVEIDDFKDTVIHGDTPILTWLRQCIKSDFHFYYNRKDIKPFLRFLPGFVLFAIGSLRRKKAEGKKQN